jgi:hypothetical protein
MTTALFSIEATFAGKMIAINRDVLLEDLLICAPIGTQAPDDDYERKSVEITQTIMLHDHIARELVLGLVSKDAKPMEINNLLKILTFTYEDTNLEKRFLLGTRLSTTVKYNGISGKDKKREKYRKTLEAAKADYADKADAEIQSVLADFKSIIKQRVDIYNARVESKMRFFQKF